MEQRSLGNHFNCQSETPRFWVSNVIFAINGAYTCYKYIKTHVLRCTIIGFKQKYGHSSSRSADESAMQSRVHGGNRSIFWYELLSGRSQIMRLCYLTPSLFKYLHKTPYYREMLDRNIESEMYFYCWWVSPVSDCAIRETSDQRGKWLKTFFTFDFHILLLQRHTDARIIPCHCISIKKDFKWGPCWEPTLPATETVPANWIVVDRFKMSQITFTSIHILANQNSYHDDKST